MLKIIKQYILNREFDHQLRKSLKKDGVCFKKINGKITVNFPEEVILRKSPSSDFSAFLQVFLEKQYSSVVSLCKLNHLKVNTILDLGANVGFTSIYFHRIFKEANIYAIEPDQANFYQMQTNCSTFKGIQAEKLAIWSHCTYLSPSFEEQSDWGKTFEEKLTHISPNNIEAIGINELITKYQLTNIDILKMDIEGAEKQVFEHDLSFLKQVKIIAIEIHEAFVSKSHIYGILKAHGFILLETGELVVGINKNLLSE